MLAWHLGFAVALVYVSLGRRRIDYRFILIGAIAPDFVDAFIGIFRGEVNWRGPAHSLLAVVVAAVAILLTFRGTTRLAVFGLAVGWLSHLVGDGMWRAPETFFWPGFGVSRFSETPREPYQLDLLVHPLSHLSTWGAELLGVAVLAWFYVAFEMGKNDRLGLFWKDGYLRP
jgi:hypothetical protein